MEEINPWKVQSVSKIYGNQWIELDEFSVVNPNGGLGIYGRVHFKNLAIGILVLDDEMNTYLVGQFRFPTNAYSWEIPEGGCPAGEDPLDAAKRELKEETGLIAHNWKFMGKLHLSNSVTDELALMYLATSIEEGEANPEETEQLSIKKLPFSAAYEMVESGIITDAISVVLITKMQMICLQEKNKNPWQ